VDYFIEVAPVTVVDRTLELTTEAENGTFHIAFS
jgi:hypothetical protein